MFNIYLSPSHFIFFFLSFTTTLIPLTPSSFPAIFHLHLPSSSFSHKHLLTTTLTTTYNSSKKLFHIISTTNTYTINSFTSSYTILSFHSNKTSIINCNTNLLPPQLLLQHPLTHSSTHICKYLYYLLNKCYSNAYITSCTHIPATLTTMLTCLECFLHLCLSHFTLMSMLMSHTPNFNSYTNLHLS